MTKPEKQSQRILIVDDDPVLQAFLEDYLTQQGYETSFCNKGEELEECLKEETIHLIILDINLPGEDGFYWLDWLHRYNPSIKVCMLSVRNEDIDRIQGLESGAHDYLVKPFNPRELLARINNLLYTSSKKKAFISFGEFLFDIEDQCLTHHQQTIKLTSTELVLLARLCKNTEQIVTRDDLSQALRGGTHHPLDRSIDVHINRLRGKIEADPSTPQYIRTVWGKGYLFHANK